MITATASAGRRRFDNPAPYSIALVVGNAAALTALEANLRTHLLAQNHAVTNITCSTSPGVIRTDPYDMIVFAPQNNFSQVYAPSMVNALPMLDMDRYLLYVRGAIMPASDSPINRTHNLSDFDNDLQYLRTTVINWPGQVVGPVDVRTLDRFQGGIPALAALQCTGHTSFLTFPPDTTPLGTAGLYIPVGGNDGSAVTVAPWIGLWMHYDDGNNDTFSGGNAAGTALIEACLYKIANP